MTHSIWEWVQGRDINLDIKRVVAYRHWCNKLWNAIKFAMINLGDDFVPATDLHNPQQLPFGCQWILSRLTAAVDSTIKALHAYQFQSATQVGFGCAAILKCQGWVDKISSSLSSASYLKGLSVQVVNAVCLRRPCVLCRVSVPSVHAACLCWLSVLSFSAVCMSVHAPSLAHAQAVHLLLTLPKLCTS